MTSKQVGASAEGERRRFIEMEFDRPWWWWAALLVTYTVLLVIGAANPFGVDPCAVTAGQPLGCAVTPGPALVEFLKEHPLVGATETRGFGVGDRDAAR